MARGGAYASCGGVVWSRDKPPCLSFTSRRCFCVVLCIVRRSIIVLNRNRLVNTQPLLTKCDTVDIYTMLAKKNSLVTPIRKRYSFMDKFQDQWNLGVCKLIYMVEPTNIIYIYLLTWKITICMMPWGSVIWGSGSDLHGTQTSATVSQGHTQRAHTHTSCKPHYDQTSLPASRFRQTRCLNTVCRAESPYILQLSLQNYLYLDNRSSYSIKQCMHGFLRTCSVNVAQQKYKICR